MVGSIAYSGSIGGWLPSPPSHAQRQLTSTDTRIFVGEIVLEWFLALLEVVSSNLGEVGPSQYSISIVGLVKFTNISDVFTEYLSRTSVGMLHVCKGFCDH